MELNGLAHSHSIGGCKITCSDHIIGQKENKQIVIANGAESFNFRHYCGRSHGSHMKQKEPCAEARKQTQPYRSDYYVRWHFLHMHKIVCVFVEDTFRINLFGVVLVCKFIRSAVRFSSITRSNSTLNVK